MTTIKLGTIVQFLDPNNKINVTGKIVGLNKGEAWIRSTSGRQGLLFAVPVDDLVGVFAQSEPQDYNPYTEQDIL